MPAPSLKDRSNLTRADFSAHPVWVRVLDYDQDQSWFGDSSEQTYRPWDGALPLAPKSPWPLVLLAASFRLSCGETYPGYFSPATSEWDTPPPQRKMRDGGYTQARNWSARRGGTPLSILALHSPVIFIGETAFDFHLRRDPDRRRKCILEFYEAVGKRPPAVFPVDFSADPGLFQGIVSGRLDGFYSFSLDQPFEIDQGERCLSGQGQGQGCE